MSGIGGMLKGAVTTVGVIFILVSVFLVIGDRFVTSDALQINETENAEGYAAMESVQTGFFENLEFMDLAVFVMVAAVVVYIISRAI